MFGAMFGTVFPILATLIEGFRLLDGFSLWGVMALHASNPLLLIIDTAPFFLGLFSYFLGRMSERAVGLQYARRKEIEGFLERLKVNNKELKEVNEALDGLLYTASHDLKTPVVNLKSMVWMLRSLVQPVENQALVLDVIDRMEKSTERFECIVADLLDISRIDSHYKEGFQVVKLKEVVAAVTQELDEVIGQKSAQIRTDFSSVETVSFPRQSLQSVLKHLVANSIKYSSPDRTPDLLLRSQVVDDMVALEVSDNGVGIDLEKHRENIFKMFKRLNKESEGMGLGLYIVKRIMDKCGGVIEVQSIPGNGATFTLLIPN